MSIEHEGSHSSVPLCLETCSVIAGWIVDIVLMSRVSIVGCRESDAIIRPVAKDYQAVARDSFHEFA